MRRRGCGVVLAALLLTVGSACSSEDDPPAAGGGGSVVEGSFSSLTYNVAGLPQGINEDQHPEQNQPLMSPLLNDYEVVVVQEDFNFYTDLLRADVDHEFQTAPHPGPDAVNPLGRDSALVGDGLNILSRLPLGELDRVPWDECAPAAADCLALKGFAVAPLTLTDGPTIDLYTLHMEAGSEADDNRVRGDALDQLAAHLEQHSAGRGVIIGGDWNLGYAESPDGDQLRAFLEQTGLRDVCEVVPCGADDDVIDRFLFRSGDDVELTPISHEFERVNFVDLASEPLSDHDPLHVDWAWMARG